MPTFEVWSLDRYDSARIVAETREEAAEEYRARGLAVNPYIAVASDRAIKEYRSDTLELIQVFEDWRRM